MRGRKILLLSIGLNVVLAAGWFFAVKSDTAKALVSKSAPAAESVSNRVHFVPLYHRQFFSWSEIESDDYQKYIANLRAIGCPEQTIRDIIVADVNQLYAGKSATGNLAVEQRNVLEAEQRSLLTRLLGVDWETANLQAYKPHVPLPLDGPVLGLLSDKTKAAVQEIAARTQAKIQAYEHSQHQAQQKTDPAELAKIEQTERDELASILTPQQLEELLFRFSATAAVWRDQLGQLNYFNATTDEFRNLFHATDGIDQQISLLGDKNNPAVQQQLLALLQQREATIKSALTPQRYAEYVKLQDPSYQAALEQAQAVGGSAQTVETLYKINQEVAVQQAIVEANSNLTDIQKQIELKKIELAQLQSQAQLTDQAANESSPPSPIATVTTQPHTVQAGESLWSMARNNATKISDIQIVNPGVDFSKLKPGDTIKLPIIEPPPQ